MTTAESHPALNHRCPFCRAEPGQACRTHRGNGRELDWPHSRRLAIVDDWRKQQRALEQALCCECGNLRSFKRARNQLAEWGDKQNWHRMTGDLKCDMCSTVTRHAILRSGTHRDSAEEFLRVALGENPSDCTDAARLRSDYRQGLPRNPYLHHRYWVAEARKAWAAGEPEVIGLCGEPMELDYDPDGPGHDSRDPNELLEPSETRADQEYEDPATGLWWMEMDCVDCLRIANARRYDRLKRQNVDRISAVLKVMTADDLTLEDSRQLRELLERIASARGVRLASEAP